MEFNYKKFQYNFGKLLKTGGKSDKEYSQAMKMTPATISRYRNGLRTPELDKIISICEYFKVSIDWILGISEISLSGLNEETKEVLDLYSLASEDDRNVVKAALGKYKDKL